MSYGEQIMLRIVLVLFLALVVFCFRVVVALLKKGWNALVNPEGKAKTPAQSPKPQVQTPKPPVQPVNRVPAPPVKPIPVQPPQPPVQPRAPEPVSEVFPDPDYFRRQQASSSASAYGSGDIPLGGGEAWSGTMRRYRIRALSGPLAGQEFSVDSGYGNSACSFGRNPDCDIRFPANTPGISGLHCRVHVNITTGTNLILLEDCGSTYGTFFSDGRRLEPGRTYHMREGDVFLLAGQQGSAFRLERV